MASMGGLRIVNLTASPSPNADTSFGYLFWEDLAVSHDGALGSTYSPQDKVLVVPLGDSIEFWDTASGKLRGRLMTPEELDAFAYPEVAVAPTIALDATGLTIFAISKSGLTVIKLPAPLDSMTPTQWPIPMVSDRTHPELHGSLWSRIAAKRRAATTANLRENQP